MDTQYLFIKIQEILSNQIIILSSKQESNCNIKLYKNLQTLIKKII